MSFFCLVPAGGLSLFSSFVSNSNPILYSILQNYKVQQAADLPSTSRGLCVFRWVLLVVGSYDWNSSSPWELCHAPVYHLPVLQTFSIQQTYKWPIPMVTEGRPRRCSPVHAWWAQNSLTIYRCSHTPFSWRPVLAVALLWQWHTLWHSGEMTGGHSFHCRCSR